MTSQTHIIRGWLAYQVIKVLPVRTRWGWRLYLRLLPAVGDWAHAERRQ